MKKCQIMFCIYVIFLLCIPNFPIKQLKILGFEHSIAIPKFSLSNYGKSIFQKEFENYWNRNFGSRNSFIIAKNVVYDWMNFAMFHSGLSGNVLQGKNGVLFEKAYLEIKFSKTPEKELIKKAKANIAEINKFIDILEKKGIQFVFVMAPNKVDCRFDQLPFIWDLQKKYAKTNDVYSVYSDLLKAEGIPYVNSIDTLKMKGKLHDSFPDLGTHWNMLGSGIVLDGIISVLNTFSDRKYKPLIVKNYGSTSKILNYEKDLAWNLNIIPEYGKKNEMYPYIDYERENRKKVKLTFWGDSFTGQLVNSVNASGFSSPGFNSFFLNHILTYDDMVTILNETEIFVMVWTSWSLNDSRISEELSELFRRMNEIQFHGWNHNENGFRWTKDKSSIKFLSFKNKNMVFKFTITDRMKTANFLTISLNGSNPKRYDIRNLQFPFEIEYLIHENSMVFGENALLFEVNEATTPRSMNVNSDDRILGIFCSNLKMLDIKE